MSETSKNASSEKVIVCAAGDVWNAAFEPVLAALNGIEGVKVMSTLDAAFGSAPPAQVMILVPDPLDWLAMLLQSKAGTTSEALFGWIESNTALMARQRRMGSRVIFAGLSVFSNADDATWAALCSRLGADLTPARDSLGAVPEISAIYRMAAMLLLKMTPVASELVADLAAVTIKTSSQLTALQAVEAALSSWARVDLRGAHSEAMLSRENLVLQLKTREKSLSDITRDLHLLGAMNEALTRKLDESMWIAQQREAVLGAVLLDDAVEQARLKAENARLQTELSGVHNSISWKITSPLRHSRRKGGVSPS